MVGPFFKNQKLGGTLLALWALLLYSACGGPAPEEYIHQFKSLQKAERVKAANQLIRFDADEVVPLLIEEADSGYIRVRFEVMHLLGRFQDERAVPTLIEGLRDQSPRVAATAAWALGQIGAPAAPFTEWHAITVWNDAPGRTAEEVVGLLRAAAEAAP